MPRFFPDGSLAFFRVDPFDATRTVSQDCSQPTPDARCRVALSDGTPIRAAVNTVIVAGGGGVAAWENSNDLTVEDTLGRVWPAAGLHPGCSPDGAYALKVLRNSYGPWRVIEKDKPSWELTPGDAHNIQLFTGGRAIYMIGVDDFCTSGLPFT